MTHLRKTFGKEADELPRMEQSEQLPENNWKIVKRSTGLPSSMQLTPIGTHVSKCLLQAWVASLSKTDD